MQIWGDTAPDFIVVLHTGLVLAAPNDPDASQWTLPSAMADSDEDLALAVSEQLQTLAEPAKPLHVAGFDIPVVEVPAAALPADTPPQRWLTPEEIAQITWDDRCHPLIQALQERLLEGVSLAGSSDSAVVRVGGTVRRPSGPWTPGVHAALVHLTNFGLDAVPKVMGTDAWDREVLGYLPGRRVDLGKHYLNEHQLTEATSWLLRLHQAMSSFRHPGPFRAASPENAEIISHNDFGQHTMCFAGNRLVGVVDWDFLAPTTARLELAWLAWTSVPLGGVIGCETAARRLQIIANTYGMAATDILAAVPHRVDLYAKTILDGAAHDPGMQKLQEHGEPEASGQRLATLLAELDDLHACVHKLNRRP